VKIKGEISNNNFFQRWPWQGMPTDFLTITEPSWILTSTEPSRILTRTPSTN
jgi:hypothetical protein